MTEMRQRLLLERKPFSFHSLGMGTSRAFNFALSIILANKEVLYISLSNQQMEVILLPSSSVLTVKSHHRHVDPTTFS